MSSNGKERDDQSSIPNVTKEELINVFRRKARQSEINEPSLPGVTKEEIIGVFSKKVKETTLSERSDSVKPKANRLLEELANHNKPGDEEKDDDDDDDDDEIGVGEVSRQPTMRAAHGYQLWCTCRKPESSDRPMIACDNDDCRYQWFHYKCVGLRSDVEVPQQSCEWYCPDCCDELNIGGFNGLVRRSNQDERENELFEAWLDVYVRSKKTSP